MYEIGIEQVIQILLCLWLMRYQMDELKDWRWADFMTQSTIGFLNFITFDYVPAEYLQKSMGKILLSMLSLSFSAAWMKTGNTGMSTGEKLLKILPLTISYWLQISSRLIALGSLMLLETDGFGFWKYTVFCLIHTIGVMLIQIIFDSSALHEMQAKGLKEILKEKIGSVLPQILSTISSTILLLRFPKYENQKQHTFVIHTAFQLLIFIENMTLVLLPVFMPSNFPSLQCIQRKKIIRRFIISTAVTWVLGVIFQVSINMIKFIISL